MSNYKALISLLDDQDDVIFTTVREKIVGLGPEYLPLLEDARDNADSLIINERLQAIIEEIQSNKIILKFVEWFKSSDRTIVSGWQLLAEIITGDIDNDTSEKEYYKLVNNIWIELNNSLTSLEKCSVINFILFGNYHFKVDRLSESDAKAFLCSQLFKTRKGNKYSMLLLYYSIVKKLNLPIYPVSFGNKILLVYSDARVALEAFGSDANPYLFYISPEDFGAIFGRDELVHSFKGLVFPDKNKMPQIDSDTALMFKVLLSFEEALILDEHYFDKAKLVARIIKKVESLQ